MQTQPEAVPTQPEAVQTQPEAVPTPPEAVPTPPEVVPTQQWPLTAGGTEFLIATGSGALISRFKFELGVKELILRGAYRIQVEERGGWRSPNVTLIPQPPRVLPPSLHSLDAALRPWAPGEIKHIVKKASKASGILESYQRQHEAELAQRGLIAEQKVGFFSRHTGWVHTPAGDAWAATAAQHLERLESLPAELESDPQSAARAAAVAGALTLLVPEAMAAVARLARRRRSLGGDLDLDFIYFSDVGGYNAGFDPIEGVGNFFDSTLDLERSLDRLDDKITAMFATGGGFSAVSVGVTGGGGDCGSGGCGGGGGGCGGGGC